MHGVKSGNWFSAGVDAWSLGAEAAVVAGMRIARISVGGTSGREEARLMVREKIDAALELQAQLLAAALPMTPLDMTNRIVRHYRRKVSANRRRLGR